MNKQKRIAACVLVMLSITVFLCQCAPSATNVISNIDHAPKSKVADSLLDASKQTSPEPLKRGEILESEISQDEPIIQIQNETSFRANYRLFSFTAEGGANTSVVVTSACDCVGLSKKIMVPLVFIFDATGKILNEGGMTYTDLAADNTKLVGEPFRKEFRWSGNLPEGEYSILVAADNSAPGGDAGDVTVKTRGLYRFYYSDGGSDVGTMETDVGGLFQAASHPVGEFKILVE